MRLFERRMARAIRNAKIWQRQLARWIALSSNDVGEALVVMPAASDGLGDQAMLQSVADNLNEMGIGFIRQIIMPNWGALPLVGPELPCVRCTLEDVEQRKEALVAAVRKARVVFAVGADVIDGHYGTWPVKYLLGVLNIAVEQGRTAVLLGHSISEHPNPEAIDLIAKLPQSVRIYVRDELSLRRFNEFVGRPATLVADVAFLVKPDRSGRQYVAAAAWVDQRKRAGDVVVCLNINGLTSEKQAEGMGAVNYWRRFIEVMLNHRPATSVLFLAHDTRGGSSDASIHRKVIDAFVGQNAERLFEAETPETAAIAKAISSSADVVLSGRMHLAIGALSEGTPTFCIAYAGKYEGVGVHLGIKDFVVPYAIVSSPDSVAEWLVERIPALPARREALRATLPSVKLLSKENFRMENFRSASIGRPR